MFTDSNGRSFGLLRPRKGTPNFGATTHGHCAGRKWTPEYQAWISMKSRCYNPKNSDYHNYGGRGITVCPEWLSFATFFADVGSRPNPAHSLDRVNAFGNYERGNVRWALPDVQRQNQRDNYRAVTASVSCTYAV